MTKHAGLDTDVAVNGNASHPETFSGDNENAVLAIRNLVFDICTQNGGGHGGSALGMAAIGVALWKYVMRYNPADPEWFDRDRFVLSNGHAAMFLYVMNHLTGYDVWTMKELKGYGSGKENGFHTLCHAHPEVQVPGVEVTTGPLGQGVANAVGLAIASKNLAGNFNKPDFPLVQSRIWSVCGDGCLMEGVALEAISLAGHLQLDNLVLIYDNNAVTCDGPLGWINTEDINAKMRSQGWHVIDVEDGTHDVESVLAALRLAKSYTGKPVFINIRTVIGVGTSTAGTHKAHHGVFDKESIAKSKALAGLDPNSTHEVPARALDFFRERRHHGIEIQREWDDLLTRYSKLYPKEAAAFIRRRSSSVEDGIQLLSKMDSKELEGKATRQSNGIILERLWEAVPSLCGGGADLVNSNMVSYATDDVFLPQTGHKGRYIRNGIREHAMASIANGIAAYNPGTFLPITATFFMFYLYAAPGVRMGALSNLPVIHIATHDSFQEGQNGPTHQPVELDSLYRAMPNLLYIRPCDGEEVLGAWTLALSNTSQPTLLSLARDPVLRSVPNTDRTKVQRGAYAVVAPDAYDVTLVSCGSALHYAVSAAEALESSRGIKVRVVSAPSLDLFEAQEEAYKDEIFPKGDARPIVSVEEYIATTWARYVTASVSMTGYGYSGSNRGNYARFGLDAEGIEKRVGGYLDWLAGRDARGLGWRQL
ncbi:dihydroxyacetone synthase [Diplodia corticola]|uniref:Dihydroxyacetone synthase n=1 Tax=Diplodia corticola TaxID=236234 RepID=A0A1J9QLB5_9PEZI|nr:dihydroxyacetone synthase [Diplodia corticola]OJD29686.1 dihydroxyacetone synthase [Diplodia corticola]